MIVYKILVKVDFQPSSPEDPAVGSIFTEVARPGSPRISVSFEPVGASMPTASGMDMVDLPKNPTKGKNLAINLNLKFKFY